MEWWIWIIAGLALVGLEMLTAGTFVFMFFGVAGVLVGAVAAAWPDFPAWAQFGAFSVVAVLSLVLFRGRLVEAMRAKPKPTQTDEMVGEVGVAYDEIPPGGVGKVELRGTVWNSRNEDEAPLAKGARCTVVRVEGLSLGVRRE